MSGYVKILAALILTAVTGLLLFTGFLKWNLPSQLKLTASLSLGDNFQRYLNHEYGFSLEYPKSWSAKTFQEENIGKTILFQGGEREGFQIFITPFYEGLEKAPQYQRLDDLLTRERILRDLPSAVIEGPMEVLIGPSKNLRALLFWSEDPLIGRTREVWFVQKGYLYEVTAYAQIDELLAGIMSTFVF